MKLFIWNNPWSESYGGSCLYVMAKDEEQARELALTSLDAGFGNLSHDQRTKRLEQLGAPTRVHDDPVAEAYWVVGMSKREEIIEAMERAIWNPRRAASVKVAEAAFDAALSCLAEPSAKMVEAGMGVAANCDPDETWKAMLGAIK